MKILCIVEVVELHEDKVGSFTIIFKIVREMKSSCKNGSLPEKSGELACLNIFGFTERLVFLGRQI